MRVRCALVALGIVCLAPGPAAAQRPSALRVGADNDAFNFWLPPWERTDQEYTSGVRGSLEYAGRAPVLGRLMRRLAGACPPAVGASPGSCASHSFSLGQAIYTAPPPTDAAAGTASPRAARPNAGWLYLQAGERDSTAESVTELSLAIGVVGPPALGEAMQRLFHSLGPEFQRPVDWSNQLPFEPGFVARYSRTTFSRPWVDNETWRAIGFASVGGAIGTILTEGVAGAGVRAGVVPPLDGRRQYVPRLDVSAEGRVRGVIRDEFLDGTFFRSSDGVAHRPYVLEQTIAMAARWRRLALVYRVSHVGRQYDAQPAASTWGTLGAEWRMQ